MSGWLVGIALCIISDDKEMNNELNKGVDREEDVAIKDKLREHKGEEVVEVDKEIEVEYDGWKDGN